MSALGGGTRNQPLSRAAAAAHQGRNSTARTPILRPASRLTVASGVPVISALLTLTSMVARLVAIVFHAGGYTQVWGGTYDISSPTGRPPGVRSVATAALNKVWLLTYVPCTSRPHQLSAVLPSGLALAAVCCSVVSPLLVTPRPPMPKLRAPAAARASARQRSMRGAAALRLALGAPGHSVRRDPRCARRMARRARAPPRTVDAQVLQVGEPRAFLRVVVPQVDAHHQRREARERVIHRHRHGAAARRRQSRERAGCGQARDGCRLSARAWRVRRQHRHRHRRQQRASSLRAAACCRASRGATAAAAGRRGRRGHAAQCHPPQRQPLKLGVRCERRWGP